ncbi:trypsin-like peptidase domain-containing protein [Streptomyces sp. S.PNR 29]|uniref:trypsin-like peptidase domain-containing protein n=1 Tax=Streptomyces sp. S.PNR 29 TaxID=2973805 RepID=UPI0025B03835|nr:trypsin-like peptidase domain-containing protein [Streptomyces sp. S.PNR 29]MDN0195870.1 trypsin-like peptidase domain-containing protein [Streptomyces sp. S.PNR 29]
MVTSGLDVARVARVVGDLPDPDQCSLGSGYRISGRLVLTASHVLDGTTAVAVVLGEDGTHRPVTCVWRDRRLDLALLRLDTDPGSAVDPVLLGSIDRSRPREVAARAVGYPRYAEIDRSTPDTPGDVTRARVAVRCSLRTADTGEAPEDLRIGIEGAAPAPAPRGASPWQGMSGAAVITTDSGLLVAVFREHLTASGVSTHEVTALDLVDDEEWRARLREEGVDPRPRPALPDGWNHVGKALKQHHVHWERVRHGQQPLVQEKLRFVDPGDDSSPGSILDRLGELASRPGLPAGVVLTGKPGAGKTRLCLETATLADSRDWLVVHLTEQAPLTRVWDSVGTAAGRGSKVLVVADDIDWLDAAADTYSTICSEAHASEVPLAVLTTAREMRLAELAREALLPHTTFDTVNVRWDSRYHADICREMVRQRARKAVKQKGRRYMERFCAGPPAVSQLYASIYENQADAGKDLADVVPRLDDAGEEGPNFDAWLKGLLGGIGLPAAFRYGDADPATVAVARIAALSPCPLTTALDFFAQGADDPRRKAGAWKIMRLMDNGLLYAQDDMLRPMHDLYADFLLGQAVLHTGTPKTVYGQGLRQVLDSGLADGHALERVVTAVDRLRGTLDEAVDDRLGRAIEAWCAEHLAALRKLVGVEAQDSDGQGLQALLTRRTWRQVAERELVEPWLRRHHRKAGALDTILAMERHLSSGISRPYLMAWIRIHPRGPRTAMAIQQALRADDITPASRQWTADLAYDWLSHANNALRLSASRPLQALLNPARNGLPHHDARIGPVLSWALRWLDRYGTTREATYVAKPLVRRPELTGAGLERTARLLLDTVVPGAPENASYAFEPVLVRHREYEDLPKDVFEQAVTDSLAWLEDRAGYGLRPEAAYVLKELIHPKLPGRDALPRAAQAAVNWLAANPGRHQQRGMVLPPLLKNIGKAERSVQAPFTEDEQAELGRMATEWLSSCHGASRKSVSEMLGAFLRTELPDRDPEELHRLADQALALLEESPDPSVARSVLPPLLRRTFAPDTTGRLLKAAFGQLPPAPPSKHTAYLLTSLLRRPGLTDDEYAQALAATLQWLDTYPREEGALGLLNVALSSSRTTRADRGRLAARAVQVLSPDMLVAPDDDKPWLTIYLCGRRAEIHAEWNRFVARACDLLEQQGHPRKARLVLAEMLAGADELDPPVLEDLHRACLDWCTVQYRAQHVRHLVIKLLDSRALSPAARRRASQIARGRFRPGAERNSANGRLLEALLRNGDLPDAEAVGQVLDTALDWLEVFPGNHSAVHPLLVQLAHSLRTSPKGVQGEQRVRRALDRLDTWLRDHPDAAPEQRQAVAGHRRHLAALLRTIKS